MDRKGTPFVYLLLINGTLYSFYIFILPHKIQRKKEKKKKNALQKESGEESLNRNHRAYNLRLAQLQLMMATHAQLQLVFNN